LAKRAGTGPLGPGKPCVSFKAYGPYIMFKAHKPCSKYSSYDDQAIR